MNQYPAIRALDLAHIRASFPHLTRDQCARVRYYRLMRWMRDELKRQRVRADACFEAGQEWRAKYLALREKVRC